MMFQNLINSTLKIQVKKSINQKQLICHTVKGKGFYFAENNPLLAS